MEEEGGRAEGEESEGEARAAKNAGYKQAPRLARGQIDDEEQNRGKSQRDPEHSETLEEMTERQLVLLVR